MEFRFDTSNILLDEITKIDNNLTVKGWTSKTRFRVEYQQLYEIVNAIGEASSFAQGLNNVITTSDKLQNSEHSLYLMKEEEKISGRTWVVGMLKIGRKKLFLQDASATLREVAPLCVLDFYIHESRQRRGYGKILFDYMLVEQGVLPGHMAVDKPSDKFVGFLRKYYSLGKQVPQVNNFVVYESFFEDRPISGEEAHMTARSRGGSRAGSRQGSRAGSRAVSPEPGSTPGTSPHQSRRNTAASPAGRPTHGPRHSSMADILHGRSDRHTAMACKNPLYQTTLDWMKTEGGPESPYYSRTPSAGGSPICRTPNMMASSPATPPKMQSRVASMAATPASSPSRSPPRQIGEAFPNGNSPQKSPSPEAVKVVPIELEEEVIDGLRDVSLSSSPIQGKTGGWRDSIARNSEASIAKLAENHHGTGAGVLGEGESVHGHIKFHHHKLW